MSGRLHFFPVPEEIIYSFLVYFEILQIWPMHHSLDKRVWLTITPFKESHSDPDMDFFCYVIIYFITFGVVESYQS